MNFKYIDERPLKTNVKLEFGHKEIVSSLKGIIKNQAWNITIGLFGNWGTGKSSIVEGLRNDLKTIKIPLILFDVWKHEGDALRRTFIKECTEQLNSEYNSGDYMAGDILMSERLTAGTTQSEDHFKIQWKKFLISVGIGMLITVALFLTGCIIYGILRLLEVDIFDSVNRNTLISFLAAGFSASLIAKFLEIFIKVEKTDLKIDKFQDPHEFELEFARIISHLKNTEKKIVITFDNLDRVSGEHALSIISTIKTFLDYKPQGADKNAVIFLIPCDVDSMKRHIADSLKGKGESSEISYVDEFLRKFFNTSLWIPDFYSTDLEKFATAKLLETEIPEFNNSHLGWLIIKVFNKNPRQIIQFINHLVSNFVLLREICNTHGLDQEFYKDNIAQLAKFLLIKQRHPECLDRYREADIYTLESEEILAEINVPEFKALLKQTENIIIPSLEPYFKGRTTKEEQDFPGIVKLIEMMKFDKGDPVEYGKSLDLTEKSVAFNTILKLEFSKLRNPIQKTVFLNYLFELTSQFDLTLGSGFYREIIYFILGKNSQEVFLELNPRVINAEILQKTSVLTSADKLAFIENFLTVICHVVGTPQRTVVENSPGLADEIFALLAANKNIFSATQLRKLQDYLVLNPRMYDLQEAFFIDYETQSFFISDKLLMALADFSTVHITHEKLYNHVSLVNCFWPQQNYTKDILLIYKNNWPQIFNQGILTDFDTALSNKFIEILRNRLAKDIFEAESTNIDNELVNIIYNHLNTILVEDIFSWLEVINILLRSANGKSYMLEITRTILITQNHQNVNKLISFYPSINEFIQIDSSIEDHYLSYLTNFPIEQENLDELAIASLIKLIEKHIGYARFTYAGELIIRNLDRLNDHQKEHLNHFLVEYIKENIEDGAPIDNINEVCRLVLSLADLNAPHLEHSGFWTLIPLMMNYHNSHLYSRLGEKLVRENILLISPEMASEIIDSMIQSMDDFGLYDNIHFHETLYFLIRERQNQLLVDKYVDRLFRHILPNSRDHNILSLAASAIEKLSFSYSDFLPQMNIFADWMISNLGHPVIQDVLLAKNTLLTVVKSFRSQDMRNLIDKLKSIS